MLTSDSVKGREFLEEVSDSVRRKDYASVRQIINREL
jgi:hypothetical protein